MKDARILRERQRAIQHVLDGSPELAPSGSAAVLAKTTTVGRYPASPSAFYALIPQDIDGAETEGAAATYVAEGSAVFYAWNAGSTAPPTGTPVVCHAVGGRWVFRYDASS